MAASNQSVGVSHPTVVPTNFEPESDTCPTCGESMATDEE